MIRRPPRSTPLYSSAASDVYKRQVNTSITNNGALGTLPRVGLQWQLKEELEQVKWYGRGPHENYWDRKKSAFVGLYNSTVTGLTEHYVRAQSNGNREDIRWVSLFDSNGDGIKITSGGKLNFICLLYTSDAADE